MQDKKRIQSNNAGSTLVMVVITIAFLTVLATLIISLATMNVQLRNQDVLSKKTFYTAEEAVDEVYANLGMMAMDEFADSYEKVAANINYEVSVGGDYVTTVQNNAFYNSMMRETFIDYALASITDENPYAKINSGYFSTNNLDENDATDIINAVKENLLTQVNAKVNSIGSLEAFSDYNNDDKYYLMVNDVVIFYKESSAKQYFSEVTVDLKLEYPNVEIAFVPDNRAKLATYNDYCLIGNHGIYFKNVNSVSINDGIYGGVPLGTNGDGITLENALVNINNTKVVSGSNINIISSTENPYNIKPTLWAQNSDIWAVNISLNKENDTLSCAPVLAITGASNSYIKDDTSANASGSSITIGGSYWGYGNNAMQTGTHVNNSAIVVNGNHSSVTLNNMQDLLLAGRAYIVYGNENMYGTSESLALRNTQELYLVPKQWVLVTNTNDGTEREMNPIVLENYKTGTGASISYNYSVDTGTMAALLNSDAFYGKHLLHDDLYEKTLIENKYECYYLKFKDTDSAAEFFKITMNDAYAGSKGIELADPIRAALKKRLEDKVDEFVGSNLGRIGISINTSAKPVISTNGYLMNVQGGVASVFGLTGNNRDEAFISKICNNFNNRYNVITKYLFEFDKTVVDRNDMDSFNYITDATPDTLIKDGISYAIDPIIYEQTLFENLIVREAVNEMPINNMTPTRDVPFIYINNLGGSGTYTVPQNATCGIIVVDNGHVQIDHDFAGLIICNGQIKVVGSNTTYSNNITYEGLTYTLESFIEKYDGGVLKPYFYSHSDYAIGVSESQNYISKLKYYDLISIQNWRKTEKE